MVNDTTKTYWHLFLAFFRVGILGFGGGPTVVPLIQHEVVKKYCWLNDDDFSQILAIGNVLPGPIITKLAGYIGYRVKGIVGCVIAIIASVVPTVILLIVILEILVKYRDNVYIAGMIGAIFPVVAVMMAVMAYEFLQKSWQDLKTLKFIIILAIVTVALWLKVSPPVIIIATIIFIFVPLIWRRPKS